MSNIKVGLSTAKYSSLFRGTNHMLVATITNIS
nr:MAG TPA: hypothetical protein [Bacteriophage sp.]